MTVPPNLKGGLYFTVTPLISAEEPLITKKIKSLITRIFKWFSSYFPCIFSNEKPVQVIFEKNKVIKTERKLKALNKSTPNFLKSLQIVNTIKQLFLINCVCLFFSLCKRTSIELFDETPFHLKKHTDVFLKTFETTTSTFFSKRALDVLSAVFTETFGLFFPSTSYQIKKTAALSLAAPIIWKGANYLSYEKNSTFFLGSTFLQMGSLYFEISGQHQALKQKNFERKEFKTKMSKNLLPERKAQTFSKK